jgi:hypothetical protein
MSCCDTKCEVPPERNTCGIIPPQPPYNSTKNEYYATYQSLPVNPYTGKPNPNYAWNLALPNNNAFTTNPQYPMQQGTIASQLVTLNQAKTIFNNLNTNTPAGMPVKFKSHQEMMAYNRAMFSLRVGLTPSNYLG